MDAAIADAINRRDAQLMAKHLDWLDRYFENDPPWYKRPIADAFFAERSDMAWWVGIIAVTTEGIAFDGAPADCDWDNLFSHLRTEIQNRRDTTEAPPVRASTLPCEMV